MKAIEKRLQELEAEQGRKDRHLVHMVTYGINYGDDVKAKRAEAEAEFNRLNPDWASRPEGDEIRLIEIRVVEAENGRPKHPDWAGAASTA